MKLPNGKEVSGWWLLVAVLVLVAILSFLPHAPDLQFRAK
jgi:hypothetical protein